MADILFGISFRALGSDEKYQGPNAQPLFSNHTEHVPYGITLHIWYLDESSEY